MGYPLDAHRILEKFPMSGIQIFFLCFKDSLNALEKKNPLMQYLTNQGAS